MTVATNSELHELSMTVRWLGLVFLSLLSPLRIVEQYLQSLPRVFFYIYVSLWAEEKAKRRRTRTEGNKGFVAAWSLESGDNRQILSFVFSSILFPSKSLLSQAFSVLTAFQDTVIHLHKWYYTRDIVTLSLFLLSAYCFYMHFTICHFLQENRPASDSSREC